MLKLSNTLSHLYVLLPMHKWIKDHASYVPVFSLFFQPKYNFHIFKVLFDIWNGKCSPSVSGREKAISRSKESKTS